MQFKAAQEKLETSAGAGSTPKDSPRVGEGPATLMSRLMRAELDRMNRGGPLRQFFNHPIVIVVLFALTLGTIIWTFWPLSAEALYSRGAALMESDDPWDWERAWTDYLEKLEEKYPDHPHKAEVAEFRRRRANSKAERDARNAARLARPMSEAEWFYHEGLRLRQRGDEAGARRVWEGLIEGFGQTATEGPWVRKAQEQLKGTKEEHPVERKLEPVRDAVAQARKLREEGKVKEADALLRALRSLYRDDPAALEIIGKE
jgi:hypothetical protein